MHYVWKDRTGTSEKWNEDRLHTAWGVSRPLRPPFVVRHGVVVIFSIPIFSFTLQIQKLEK